jgi:hypothetical protein
LMTQLYFCQIWFRICELMNKNFVCKILKKNEPETKFHLILEST